MSNVNNTINDIVDKVKPFVMKHRIILICALVFLVLMIIGGNMYNSATGEVASAERELADINNAIAQFDSQKHDIQYQTKHIDHGLDTARWKSDDAIAAQWIQPAFTWRDASEYTENRDLYINRLTEFHPFVTEFMPVYIPEYQAMSRETADIDDGTHISSRVTSFNSYVVKIDETSGVYSYLALLRCETLIPYSNYTGLLQGLGAQGRGAENTVVMTYDMNKDGDLMNFSVFMNYYDGYEPSGVNNNGEDISVAVNTSRTNSETVSNEETTVTTAAESVEEETTVSETDSGDSESISVDSNAIMVLYTSAGDKYHLRECSDEEEYLSCTFEEAIIKGLKPCEKCFGQ